MITTSAIYLTGDSSEVLYCQCRKSPIYAWEQWSRDDCAHCSFFADPRIPAAHRTDPSDYCDSTHEPCGLIGKSRALSAALPVTPKVNQLYLSISDLIPDISDKVNRVYSAAGPIYKSGVKLLQLQDRSAWIPHFIWRSVLAEFPTGAVRHWSFIIKNIANPVHLDDTLVPTSKIEALTGLSLWSPLQDEQFQKSKHKATGRWW